MSEWIEDDYPTDAAIARVKAWSAEDIPGLWAFLQEIWHWPEAAQNQATAHEQYVAHLEKDDRVLRLATGGWSGNEDLIAAYSDNLLVWALTWRLSSRGGLHLFAWTPRLDQP